MARVVGIDHLVLRVGDFAKSKRFYDAVLGFLGFTLKYEFADAAGWSNGKTLFWIGAADARGRKRRYRIGDIGFHHYAFELARRRDVDDLGAFLKKKKARVVDPPADYPDYGKGYYAVYFLDPDGMKLEGMFFPTAKKKPARKRTARKTR
jgi:catechol 2,3-dioxygenase-like lactoylglutathione lyase family enzyme